MAYTGLNLLSAATVVSIVSQWHESQVVQQIEKRLHYSAMLVRGEMVEMALREIQLGDDAKDHLKKKATRLTLD